MVGIFKSYTGLDSGIILTHAARWMISTYSGIGVGLGMFYIHEGLVNIGHVNDKLIRVRGAKISSKEVHKSDSLIWYSYF